MRGGSGASASDIGVAVLGFGALASVLILVSSLVKLGTGLFHASWGQIEMGICGIVGSGYAGVFLFLCLGIGLICAVALPIACGVAILAAPLWLFYKVLCILGYMKPEPKPDKECRQQEQNAGGSVSSPQKHVAKLYLVLPMVVGACLGLLHRDTFSSFLRLEHSDNLAGFGASCGFWPAWCLTSHIFINGCILPLLPRRRRGILAEVSLQRLFWAQAILIVFPFIPWVIDNWLREQPPAADTEGNTDAPSGTDAM